MFSHCALLRRSARDVAKLVGAPGPPSGVIVIGPDPPAPVVPVVDPGRPSGPRSPIVPPPLQARSASGRKKIEPFFLVAAIRVSPEKQRLLCTFMRADEPVSGSIAAFVSSNFQRDAQGVSQPSLRIVLVLREAALVQGPP